MAYGHNERILSKNDRLFVILALIALAAMGGFFLGGLWALVVALFG